MSKQQPHFERLDTIGLIEIVLMIVVIGCFVKSILCGLVAMLTFSLLNVAFAYIVLRIAQARQNKAKREQAEREIKKPCKPISPTSQPKENYQRSERASGNYTK